MSLYSVGESLKAWETNAKFWDDSMGEHSNRFHREVVRPKVTELLCPQPGELILDAACGNGNYSAYLAERGVRVVAFDYSPSMIALAKKRQEKHLPQITFHVADATNTGQIMALKQEKPYDKAVSNMAVMDIADAAPLFQSINRMLGKHGIFVFATQHPCFITLTEQYLTPHSYKDIAIEGQPVW